MKTLRQTQFASSGIVVAALAMTLASFAPAPATRADEVPDKASPFTAVRWEGDQPIVRFEGSWYSFEGLDGLSKAEILAYAKGAHGDRWKKRFSEDLVEVLQGMGHAPGVEVRLALQRDGETLVETGRMTEENRRSVWRYNQGEDEAGEDEERAHAAPPPAGGSDVARMYAEEIDRVWSRKPKEGKANLRFLLKQAGRPFAGLVDIRAELNFSARGGRGLYVTQGFNPNANGRWVYEDLEPGTYDLLIQGSGRFDGWEWHREAVEVVAGQAPLFEVDLDR